MADNDHNISVLNDLIEVTLDSANGYADAARDTKNPQLKTLFGKRGIERKQVAAELQTEIRRLLGGDPAQAGTTLGKVHRTMMNLKASLTGSDAGIVNAVEAGEDHIKAEYEQALVDQDLARPVHALIQTAYASVLAGHNEMRDLKRLLNA